MITVNDILTDLNEFSPPALAESWDNVGLLVGSKNSPVSKTLIALDCTLNVLKQAISTNCNLIIAHHPLIFGSLKVVTPETSTGEIIMLAIKHDICIICMHTNLDSCNGGVNDVLANTLGLSNIENLGAGETKSLGRVGNLNSPTPLLEFLPFVKQKLSANGLKFVGTKDVFKVCVLGGSGSKMVIDALSFGCDTFITGDCSYHDFQLAENLGINLIDAGHFATENPICNALLSRLSEKFNEEFTLANHSDLINFF